MTTKPETDAAGHERGDGREFDRDGGRDSDHAHDHAHDRDLDRDRVRDRERVPEPAAAPVRLSPAVQYALLAGPLLSMLDSSIVNVAVEPISRELHASLGAVQWAVSGYLLALGTGLAAVSYLSRRFGTLPVYRAAILLFTLASAACAAAPDATGLIAARIVQGLAGAPLVPLAMSMSLGRSGAARSVSPVAGVLLFLGPALGPTVGGALIAAADWRVIFLINLPTGLLAALASRRVPAGLAPGRSPGARFDLPGLLLLSTGLAAVLLGITRGGTDGWSGAGVWALIAVGLVLLAVYGHWSTHREQPALDLALIRSRTPVLAVALCAAASVVTFAAVFLLPVFVQSAQGHSALTTGLAMAPQGVLTGLGTVLGQRILLRLSVRTTVVAGFALLGAAGLGVLAINAHTPLAVTAAILACRSASIGLVISPLLALLTGDVEAARLGDVNTLFNICQRVAGSLGVGLIAALYTQRAATAGPVAALHDIGVLMTGICVVAVLFAALLPAVRATPISRFSR